MYRFDGMDAGREGLVIVPTNIIPALELPAGTQIYDPDAQAFRYASVEGWRDALGQLA